MWKTVLAGTTALAIAGTTLAFAQQGQNAPDRAQRWRPTAADITAFGDARIAAVHAGLALTPDQEKLWPPVEAALHDMYKQRSSWFTARASADRPKNPIERMSLRAQTMSDRGATLQKVADASAPLYKSLDDGQKHRFIVLARLGGERDGHHGWRHRGFGGNRGQGGPGQNDPQPQ
jgi:zinc resistance-associated protein